MKKIFLLSLPILFFLISTTPAFAFDFHVTNFSSHPGNNPTYPVLDVDYYDNDLVACSLIDNATNSSVDNILLSDPESWTANITLTIPVKDTPTGWTPDTTYHLSCTKSNNNIVNSNDFKYLPAPIIDHVTQNDNLVDVYLLPYPDNYISGQITSLRADGWFDDLGYGICESTPIDDTFSSPVCHHDFFINPGLPSTNKARLKVEFNTNDVQYYFETDDLFTVQGVSNQPPSVSAFQDATLDEGETYTETGQIYDGSSYALTATVDYGDGSGIQSLPLIDTEEWYYKNFSLNHQYTTAGEYTLTVSVTDDQDATGTHSATVTVINNDPVTVTFNASSDTYVRSGQDNHNYGAGIFMNLQSSGSNRSLVKFDQSELQNAIGSGTVLSATLKLTITDNGNNWGTGRTVDVHRLIADWAEGTGTENSRGTGNGATWNCAIDSLIENQSKNCSGSTEWEMGQPNNPNVHPWNATATDTKTITNNQSGVVEFDVTSDVASFMNGSNTNYGWLLKKTNEGQNGQVSFGTRESSAVPELIITYQP